MAERFKEGLTTDYTDKEKWVGVGAGNDLDGKDTPEMDSSFFGDVA
jgi:hypothetical protein